MEVQRHEGKSLQYLAIHPDGYRAEVEYPLVVLLHGFDASMHDLAGLCPSIDGQGYVYVCPNAPLTVQVGLGQQGYAWTPPFQQGTLEDTKRAEGMLETFFDEVIERYNVPPGRALLMGFSQGGGMTYRCGLVKPDVFAGLGALSAFLPDPEELKDRLPAQRSQPIFIAHGIHDSLAPVERARQARDFLEAEGYQPRYREYSMPHEITQEVLGDLVPWIKEVLPPAAG